MKIHHETEEKLRMDIEENNFLKWAYMLQVTAGAGNIQQDGAKSIIDKAKDNLTSIIQKYVNPFKKANKEEKRKQITEEEKTQFLEEMGQFKFNSLGEILKTIEDKSQ